MNFESKILQSMQNDSRKIFHEGLSAVEPGAAIKKYCKLKGNIFHIGGQQYDISLFKNIFVIGFGKATAPMAAALEQILGKRINCGIISVKYGHVAKLDRIKINEAGHPLPDQNGQKAAESILKLAKTTGKDDLVFCLISGGGSALLPLPHTGITLKDKQDTLQALFNCSATIHEINALRKHISMIKGGRLAEAVYPATLISLILSDVVGDDLDVIASGPTVFDSTTFSICMEILNKYNITNNIPHVVVNHIKSGVLKKLPETPKSDHPGFEKTRNLIVGSNGEALTAAKKKAESLGYNTIILSSMIEGETRHVARVHSAIAKEILKTKNPLCSPACIISGGETTVKITGTGLGGRNQEFALAAAFDIAGNENIVVLSGGTDGTDGPTEAAGAFSHTFTIKKALSMGIAPYNFLNNNDSYHFFQKLDDLFITGPTNTNVMDLRIVLVRDACGNSKSK